jgi:hypothetical protein
MTTSNPPDGIKMRQSISKIVALLFGTLAFPIAWYGCQAVEIWIAFVRKLGATPLAGQLSIWRGTSATLGDIFLFAIALWLVHMVMVVIRRSAWRTIPGEFRGMAGSVAGALTYLLGRVSPLVLPADSPLIPLLLIVFTVGATEAVIRVFRRIT